jgi:hypothetical protein
VSKMREHADHYDGDLLLRLYHLRHEERLREARDWFIRDFHADSTEEFYKRFPFGSKENDDYRMVLGYWEMAASLVNRGLINEELFFENNGELWTVWTKITHLMPEARAMWKNPHLFQNLEILADKYEKWMEARAPGAVDLMREQMKTLTAKKTVTSEG